MCGGILVLTRTMRALVMALALCAFVCVAAQAISANVVMKTSKVAQDSIVNEGEDLSISVSLDDDSITAYRWYFNDEPITGAIYDSYDIISAAPDDAGLYRMDAFDAESKMIVSMEFNVRVIEKALPKAGDDTLSKGALIAMMAAAAGAMGFLIIRKRREA